MSDTLDDILDEASPAEDTVALCLNGRLRRQYRELSERISDRRDAAERAALVTRATAVVDDRLGVKAGSGPDGEPLPVELGRDPEQDLLDELAAKIQAQTIRFEVRALDPDVWNRLVEAHPPRKDPTTGRIVQDDLADGVNTDTFYEALVAESLAVPVFTDEQYERARKAMNKAQFARLAKAAAAVNVQDDDLPF